MVEFWRLLTENSNVLELLQTLAAFAGMVFSVWAVMDATKDSMALAVSGVNGARKVIAVGNIIAELERLGIHTILFVIGLSSVFLPPPFGPNEPVSSPELLQHTITRIGLLLVTIVKVAGAIRMRRERTKFIRQMGYDGYPKSATAAMLAPPPGCIDPKDPRILRKDSHLPMGEKREHEK